MDLEVYAILNKKMKEAGGVPGKDGITPNITIGTVTTLEPNEQATVENVGTKENPIFNFGIPKGQDGNGGGSASIDDTTLSTNKTWSSAKIEDFVLNNDNTVWLDQSGENLKIDSTKEGYLREVEIWGNTIQNEEDLSDIKHLGELYVDEDGEPILDSQGREQYKVEVKSFDYNRLYTNAEIVNLYNSMGYSNVKAELVDGKFSMKSRGYWISPVKVFTGKPNTVYTFCVNTTGDYFSNSGLTLVKKYSSSVLSYRTDSTGSFGFLVYPTLNEPFDFKIFEGQIENLNNIVDCIYKTTILLPCQLMKVGAVSDRLYWDSEKGKYVIEKNIIFKNLNKDNLPTNIPFLEPNRVEGYTVFPMFFKDLGIEEIDNYDKITSNRMNFVENGYSVKKTGEWICSNAGIYLILQINNDNLSSLDRNGLTEWLGYQGVDIYCKKVTPQLIETNITEQIKLPTYINATYITVNGRIQGSIKAKAPVDGSVVVNSLVLENKELKATNEVQDELINVTMLATDEMFMMLEPLLVNTLSISSESKMVDMYVAMVQRGLKKEDEIPERYKEQVKELLRK